MKPENIRKLPRYKELAELQAYFESKQYDGRPDFWSGTKHDGDAPVPLRLRKPCIIYPLPKAASQQVVRFMFGDRKFPQLKVEPQKDDAYAQLTLTAEEAETLAHGLVDIIENGGFKSTIRALAVRGLSERTAVGILAIKKGRFAVDLAHAKDCYPVFQNDDPNDELLSVTWCYQYDLVKETPEGPKKELTWFRRDVDATSYLQYPPIKVEPNKPDVDWGTPTVTPHDYGFCPVLWIRNLSEDGERGNIDGASLYEGLGDQFDALNFALSQRHRGINFFGTPQPYETGVEDGDGPEADGNKTGPIGYSKASDGRGAEIERGGGRQSQGVSKTRARRMAPDRIWSYEGTQVTVGLIETTGKAFEVATLHVKDIRERALEAMSVVLAGMEQFTSGGGEMNAKFLVLAFAPLLNLVAELRDATWWPNGLQALLSMALRILAKTKGEGIVMPKAKILAELVTRFEVLTTTDGPQGKREENVWMLPKITPVWGDAFDPSNAEVTEAVTSAVTAKEGGLIPQKQATQYVATYFGIDDVDAAVEELVAKADEDAAKALEAAEAAKPDPAAVPAAGQPAGKPPQPTDGPQGPKT